MNNNYLIDIFVLLLPTILLILALSTIEGCTVEPTRQFNSEDILGYSCHEIYGGTLGYCDNRRNHE